MKAKGWLIYAVVAALLIAGAFLIKTALGVATAIAFVFVTVIMGIAFVRPISGQETEQE
jgi:UPF0716 family protein affecting phage T7 exclusion